VVAEAQQVVRREVQEVDVWLGWIGRQWMLLEACWVLSRRVRECNLHF
jgi:hypothetical protein